MNPKFSALNLIAAFLALSAQAAPNPSLSCVIEKLNASTDDDLDLVLAATGHKLPLNESDLQSFGYVLKGLSRTGDGLATMEGAKMGRAALQGVQSGFLVTHEKPKKSPILEMTLAGLRNEMEALTDYHAGYLFYFSWLKPTPHEEFLWCLDLARSKSEKFREIAPDALKALPEDALRFVEAKYRSRFKHIASADIDQLFAISRSLMDRTFLIVKTSNGPIQNDGGTLRLKHDKTPISSMYSALDPKLRETNPKLMSWKYEDPQEILEREPFEVDGIVIGDGRGIDPFTGKRRNQTGHDLSLSRVQPIEKKFEVTGVISAVRSSHAGEPLPVEILMRKHDPGFQIERKPGEVLIEIGRFAAEKDALNPISPELINAVSSLAIRSKKVDRIVIQVDAAHRKLFGPLGFSVLREFQGIQGKEYLLEIRPEKLLESVLQPFVH